MTARVVEPMGNEIFLHGDSEAGHLLARIGPSLVPRVGRRYRLDVEGDRCHLFDPAGGRSLLLPDSVGAEA